MAFNPDRNLNDTIQRRFVFAAIRWFAYQSETP